MKAWLVSVVILGVIAMAVGQVYRLDSDDESDESMYALSAVQIQSQLLR